MIVFLAAGLLAPPAAADGKFYAPDQKASPTEPFQRALIFFNGEREVLLIQPSAQGADAEFGWIVPVPSVPAVGTIDRAEADHLFLVLSIWNGPRVLSVSALAVVVILGALLSWLVIRLMRGQSTRHPWIALAFFAPVLLFCLLMSITGGLSSSTVNVLDSGRIGIYETKVIQASVAEDLVAWLRAEEFAFDPEDVGAFEDAIARGWCFVVSKIAADAPPISETYLDAILLEFETKEVIYPYALTATVDHPVTVSLAVIAPTRVGCEELTTRVALPIAKTGDFPLLRRDPTTGSVTLDPEQVEWVLGADRFTTPFLLQENGSWYTWLYRTLEPGQVAQDIVLTPREAERYREWALSL